MMPSTDRLPKVTLVVPVYNGEDYVAEALDSILAQDYANLEAIVVNDGSKDGTPDILARYADRMTVTMQANAGQSAALASGWRAASGALIGYLSADDRLAPSAISRSVAALMARPDAVLSYPDFNIIDENSSYVSVVTPHDYSRRTLYADLVCLPGPGALFRKEAYEKAGPWRSELRQVPDLDFFLRLALLGDFLHIPDVLADFRRHSGSTTYSKAPFERGEEPKIMLDTFFARPDLPSDISAWRSASYANGLLLASLIHGGSGRRGTALQRLIEAFGHAPGAVISHKGLAALRMLVRGHP